MATVKLEKTAWKPYFDEISKTLGGKQAEIEVTSLEIGDQIEAEWVPWMGISYDPKDDMVEVLLEGLDHRIPHAKEIYVDRGTNGLISIEVVDGDGAKQIIKLRDPLMLPAPGP